jgi:hypothetical protein
MSSLACSGMCSAIIQESIHAQQQFPMLHVLSLIMAQHMMKHVRNNTTNKKRKI